MDGWGLNPTTVQAIGAGATLFALVFIIWAATIASKESALRTRPWVGLTGASVSRPPTSKFMLRLSYSNTGVLPALNLLVRDLVVYPAEGCTEEESTWGDIPMGAVFPDEPSHWDIYEVASLRVSEWLVKKVPLTCTGKLSYGYGESAYSTEFELKIQPDLVDWSNTDAT